VSAGRYAADAQPSADRPNRDLAGRNRADVRVRIEVGLGTHRAFIPRISARLEPLMRTAAIPCLTSDAYAVGLPTPLRYARAEGDSRPTMAGAS